MGLGVRRGGEAQELAVLLDKRHRRLLEAFSFPLPPPPPPTSLTPAANAGDVGSIPGSGRSLGEGNGSHSSVLAWRTPWTEEPGGPQSMGSKELDTTEQLNNTSNQETLQA